MRRINPPIEHPNIIHREIFESYFLAIYELICQRVIPPVAMPETKYLPSIERSITKTSAASSLEKMSSGKVLAVFKKTIFLLAEKINWFLILALMQLGNPYESVG